MRLEHLHPFETNSCSYQGIHEHIVVADGDVGEGGILPGGRLYGERADGILEVFR